MENLELLVKLASFGTAGVCVLAIFIIGTSIFKLPNDTPAWKVALMKMYMNICVIIAIICTISGGANAYFNQAKIAKANENLSKLGAAYDEESQKVENEKREINNILVSLRSHLQQANTNSPEVLNRLNDAEKGINRLQLTPRKTILNR